MKSLGKRMANAQGTILIFALLIVLGSSLVLAAWVRMLASATVYPDTTAQAVQARVGMENARALARQYLLSSLPGGRTATNVTWVASISNGDWGACSVNASAGFWTETNAMAGNPFSPFGDRCFAVTNLATFSNSLTTWTWRFFVKSRSPLLAEYPLVVHQTATTNLAWAPTNKIYYTNTIPFYDFPRVPFTSGTNGSDPIGYLGYFAAPISTYSETNSLGVPAAGFSYTNATNTGASVLSTNKSGSTYTTNYSGGRLTAVLNSTQTNSILRYDVPATLPVKVAFTSSASGNTYINTYTNAGVTNLTIVGSSTRTNVLHIVIDSGNTTTVGITLSGTNNTRRIYLNKQSTNNLNLRTATTTNSYNWWFGATMDNSALTVTAPSGNGNSLTLTTGLRSERDITISSGTLNLAPATNSASVLDFLEIVADRVLWLEDGRNR